MLISEDSDGGPFKFIREVIGRSRRDGNTVGHNVDEPQMYSIFVSV